MSEWEGLRGCEICGNDTTGRLCNSCRTQEMIDISDYVPASCPKCKSLMVLFDWSSDEEGWECRECRHKWGVEG